MNGEVITLAAFTACGGIVCLVFDIMRGLRRAIGERKICTHISDLIFWVTSAAVCMFCLWNFNSGEIRLFEFVGFSIGCVLYFLLLSAVVLKVFTLIFVNILKFMRFVLKILLTPAKFLYKIVIVIPIRHVNLITVRKRKHNGKVQS